MVIRYICVSQSVEFMLIVSNLYRLVLVFEELCSTTMDLAEKKLSFDIPDSSEYAKALDKQSSDDISKRF